jgi:hypothetical protein
MKLVKIEVSIWNNKTNRINKKQKKVQQEQTRIAFLSNKAYKSWRKRERQDLVFLQTTKSLPVLFQEKALLILIAQCKINKGKIWTMQFKKRMLWSLKIKSLVTLSQLSTKKYPLLKKYKKITIIQKKI